MCHTTPALSSVNHSLTWHRLKKVEEESQELCFFLLLLFVHGCKIHRYPGLHRLALESLLSFSLFSPC